MKKLYLLLLLCFGCIVTHAQEFPVQVTNFVQAPYPIFVEDISNPAQPKWNISLNFRDFQEASRNVHLRISIESSQLRIQTNPNAVNLPLLTIFPGVPLQINANDIADYLTPQNTIVAGSQSTFYNSTGQFAEGMYFFCVEVIDAFSGEVLSLKQCASAYLEQQNPPLLNFPICGSVIDPDIPQNIAFNWQNFSQPQPGSFNEYQFSLYQINDKQVSPLQALANNQVLPVYTGPWQNSTSVFYDISFPKLESGERYLWQVQARDQSGESRFKNDGFSEPCYFSFGYPQGGLIQLTLPIEGGGFTKLDDQYLTWDQPSNTVTGQPIQYKLKIKAYNDGEDRTEVIEEGEVWHEYQSDILYNNQNWNHAIDKSLKRFDLGQQYIWQVEAFTGNIKVASSDINLFSGPPIIESFFVGPYEVFVSKLFNKDLTNLSGEGFVAIDDQGTLVPINFKDLGIENVAGLYFLNRGIIEQQLETPYKITLNPTDDYNIPTIFKANTLKLGKDLGFQLKGEVLYQFPLISEDEVELTSEDYWAEYHYYKISAAIPLAKGHTVPLIDPYGFTMDIRKNSDYLINQNKYTLRFNGRVTMPETISNGEGELVIAPFSKQPNLFYITETEQRSASKIIGLTNANMFLMPDGYTLDFSDEESPLKHNDNPDWKGYYLNNYRFLFKSRFEQAHSFNFAQKIELSIEDSSTVKHHAWVTTQGLTVKAEEDFTGEEPGVLFNTFVAQLNQMRFNVQLNELQESYIDGRFQIPIISETEYFSFTVPFTTNGYALGYLNETLDGKKFEFNPDGGEQRMLIDIKRAVFQEHNHLNITMDIEYPFFDVTLKEVNEFKIWGNYNVGFGKPNGIVALTNQVDGNARTYKITVDQIGAGRDKSLYSFGISSTINLGEDATGDDGPPRINAYSIYDNALVPEKYVSPMDNGTEEADGGLPTFDGFGLDEYEASDQGGDQNQSDYNDNPYNDENGMFSEDYNGSFEDKNDPLWYLGDDAFSDPGDQVDPLTIEEFLELVKVIRPFIQDEKKRAKLDKIIDAVEQLTDSEVYEIMRQIEEQGGINLFLKAQVDALVVKAQQPVNRTVDKINAKVDTFIHGNIDKVIDLAFNPIDSFLIRVESDLKSVIPSDKLPILNPVLTTAVSASRIEIRKEITEALHNNVRLEITLPIQTVVDTVIRRNINDYIDSAITSIGYGAIDQNISDDQIKKIVNDLGGVFTNIGQDFLNVVTEQNAEELKERMIRLAREIAEDIDLPQVAIDIGKQMQDEAIKAVGNELVDEIFGGLDSTQLGKLGAAAGIIGDNVQFDLDNVGEKLKNGDIGSIVKFDYTKINIESKIADISGQIDLKRDDPIWGDCFKGDVVVVIKKPSNKQKTIAASFVKGKTLEDMHYWKFDLAVLKGLGLPLVPNAVLMDGIKGTFYQRMSMDESVGAYLPDPTNRFGAGVHIFCTDFQTKKQYNFDVRMEYVQFEDYFTLDLNGNFAGVLKEKMSMPKPGGGKDDGGVAEGGKDGEAKPGGGGKKEAFVFGTAFIGYNSKEKLLLGGGSVDLNTRPMLCAGGDMSFMIDGKNKYWQFEVGTYEQPNEIKLLCMDFAKIGSWFDINSNGLEVGLRADIDIRAETPRIGSRALNFRAYAEFRFFFEAMVDIEWVPQLALREAMIAVELSAAVGVKYKTPLSSGDFVVAALALGGKLHYKNTAEEAFIYGMVRGKVIVLSVGFDAKLDVKRSLS